MRGSEAEAAGRGLNSGDSVSPPFLSSLSPARIGLTLPNLLLKGGGPERLPHGYGEAPTRRRVLPVRGGSGCLARRLSPGQGWERAAPAVGSAAAVEA